MFLRISALARALILTTAAFCVTNVAIAQPTPAKPTPTVSEIEELKKNQIALRRTIDEQAILIGKLSEQLKEVKNELKAEDDKIRIDLNKSNTQRDNLEAYFNDNITRIKWRSVEVTFTKKDQDGRWEADFGDDTPEAVTVVIRGISLTRNENKVSIFQTHVGGVSIQGNKVTGTYRCCLTDSDSNGPDSGSMSLDVFAVVKLAPKRK